MTTNTAKGFSVRLKPDLKEWVSKRSSDNMRSLNAEINVLLTAVKGQMERQQGKQEA